MSIRLPDKVREQIKQAVYRKADAFGYSSRNRIENGVFLDELVEDPEVGLVLLQHIERDRIRTYIKDGVLNRYTKDIVAARQQKDSSEDIAKRFLNTSEFVCEKQGSVSIFIASPTSAIVISEGTVLKWETALRKALELIARSDSFSRGSYTPQVCLKLAIINNELTEGDKSQIRTALQAIKVTVVFV